MAGIIELKSLSKTFGTGESQVSILKKHDLDAIQGYYFAKPLEVSEFEALLDHNKFEEAKEKETKKTNRRAKKGGEGK